MFSELLQVGTAILGFKGARDANKSYEQQSGRVMDLQDRVMNLGAEASVELEGALRNFVQQYGNLATITPATIDAVAGQFLRRREDNTQRAVKDASARVDVQSLNRMGTTDSTYDIDLRRALAADSKTMRDRDELGAYTDAMDYLRSIQGLRGGEMGATVDRINAPLAMKTGNIDSALNTATNVLSSAAKRDATASSAFGKSLQGLIENWDEDFTKELFG